MSCATCQDDDCHPDCPHQARCPSCGTAYTAHLGLVGTCAELVRLRELLRRVAQGLEDVRHPTPGAGREWQSDLGVYLRGQACGRLFLGSDDMRELEALAALEGPA